METRELAAFPATERFEAKARLGTGACGVVYSAWDRARGEAVALKVLREVSPISLPPFKREFRALRDLRHDNLVGLHELFVERNRWFFTMDLIEGQQLLPNTVHGTHATTPDAHAVTARLEPSELGQVALAATDSRAPALPPAVIRSRFAQLAQGLAAIHGAGRLHRDVKPSNVMVERGGRVVVVDYGLVADLGRRERAAGTLEYMAPEQALGAELSPACDWYAFGVCLYQAISGCLPLAGAPLPLLQAKRRLAPTPLNDVVALEDERLGGLVDRLLKPFPGERPGVDEILDVLGEHRATPSLHDLRIAGSFEGRAAELDWIAGVCRQALERRVVIVIEGAGGVGKSALLRRALLEGPDTPGLVAGRCYERESVPYKALDSVVVSSREGAGLAHLDDDEHRSLARLLPSLATEPGPVAPLSPRELRARAARAVAALLTVSSPDGIPRVWIDDAQWGDRDSCEVLQEAMPAERPGLLVVSTRPGASEFLDALGPGARRLRLAPMADDDARRLVTQRAPWLDPERVGRILVDSAGSPFLLEQLALDDDAAPSLAGLVRRRLGELEAGERALTLAVAAAAQPLDEGLLIDAAGLVEGRTRAITGLLSRRLVKRQGPTQLVAFHDRMREALLDELPTTDITAAHQRLATVLEERDGEPLTIAEHWVAAGQAPRASRHFTDAGRRAYDALAFAHAAELYRRALEHARDERYEAGTGLARALAAQGLGPDSAAAWTEAVDAAGSEADALECRRAAAEQLLVSGHLARGLAGLEGVLRAVGASRSVGRLGTVLQLLWWQAQLRWDSTLRSRRPTERERLTVDATFSAGRGFAMVDFLRAAAFTTRAAVLALRAGDSARSARTLALESGLAGAAGVSNRRRARRRLDLANGLAEHLDDAHAKVLIAVTRSSWAWYEGHWGHAQEEAERGLELARRRCAHLRWEQDTLAILALDAIAWRGRFDLLRQRLPTALADARERGDLFVETLATLRFGSMVALADDAPDTARAGLGILARWSQGDFQFQHLVELHNQAEIDLYLAEPAAALVRLDRSWGAMRRALLLQSQAFRITMRSLRGRAALGSAARCEGRLRRRLLRRVRRDARAIQREGGAWAEVAAGMLDAGAALLAGRGAAACRAVGGQAAALGMDLHHAVAMRAAAMADGDEEGEGRWTREIDALGVQNPAAMARVVLPGG